jgi:hypothetical protein
MVTLMRNAMTLALCGAVVATAGAQRPSAARRAPVVALSALYTSSALTGAYLAIRDSLPQAPFGMRTGRTPRADFLTGTGTALSPGLPLLLLQAGVTGMTAGSSRVSRAAVGTLAVGGVLYAIGQLAEPVGRHTLMHPHAAGVARTLVVAGNVVLPALMSAAAVRALR